MNQPDLFTAPGAGRTGFCAELAAFFRAHPNEWIDGQALARIAGAYAWRSRVSDLRRPPYQMFIQNRLRRVRCRVTSEYRWISAPEQTKGRDT
jgi:hypothetical protein